MSGFGDIRSAIASKSEHRLVQALKELKDEDPDAVIHYVRSHLDGYCPPWIFEGNTGEREGTIFSLDRNNFAIKGLAVICSKEFEIFNVDHDSALKIVIDQHSKLALEYVETLKPSGFKDRHIQLYKALRMVLREQTHIKNYSSINQIIQDMFLEDPGSFVDYMQLEGRIWESIYWALHMLGRERIDFHRALHKEMYVWGLTKRLS